MIEWHQEDINQASTLIPESPLRAADPRAKLFMCLGFSLTIMLPLPRLLLFSALYVIFLWWGKVLSGALRQVWRLKWVMLVLFVFDWWLVDVTHAATVVSRLAVLTGTFTVFFGTTTTRELSLALEHLSIPHRYAFSLGIAFQSLGLLGKEWQAIKEAQSARGAWEKPEGLGAVFKNIKDWISLTVPAVVLTTKRAWSITEAAYARGFDSPRRRPYRSLTFQWWDWMLLSGLVLILAVLIFWRG